jgi:serine/threonine-protein kinase
MGISDLWKREQLEQGFQPSGAKPPEPLPLPEREAEMIGRLIGGKYLIENVLGKGGMGVLYLARHKVLGRRFVVKIIRLALLDSQAQLAVRRFRREAQALAKVLHPCVVEVIDYDLLDETTPYFVMEYVEGRNLAELLEDHPQGMKLESVLAILEQICLALDAVHGMGIVHRDLKPSNVMVREKDGQPFVKLLDFGLVQVPTHDLDASSKLTGTGQMIGTPAYMAPEQCRGEEVNGVSDLYALGLLTYEMLAGVPAMDGDSFVEVIELQLSGFPPPLQRYRGDLPPHIAQVIEKAVVKSPAKRFQTAAAFFAAMKEPGFTAISNGPNSLDPSFAPPPEQRFTWRRILTTLEAKLPAWLRQLLAKRPD